MKLVYTSNPLSLVIENYEPMSFEYNGWKISDEYEFCKKNPHSSEYKITISSSDVKEEKDLDAVLPSGNTIAKTISRLLPFSTFLSLNEPAYINITRTLSIVNIRIPPKGWSSNYEDISRDLAEQGNSSLKVKVTIKGYGHFTECPKSPIADLKVMLENYDSLAEKYKFLIFLHNAILESEDENRYMLIGKALEIVNTIYPYEHHRNKNDDRIEKYHPELLPTFEKKTIQTLINWSNNRQEARHYFSRGAIPHPPLTMEEREQLYICSMLLITNIIRLQFGVEVITIGKG